MNMRTLGCIGMLLAIVAGGSPALAEVAGCRECASRTFTTSGACGQCGAPVRTWVSYCASCAERSGICSRCGAPVGTSSRARGAVEPEGSAIPAPSPPPPPDFSYEVTMPAGVLMARHDELRMIYARNKDLAGDLVVVLRQERWKYPDDDRLARCRAHFSTNTPGVTGLSVRAQDPITVAGVSGYRLSGSAESRRRGSSRSRAVRAWYLFFGGYTCSIVALYDPASPARVEPELEAMLGSFRIKGRSGAGGPLTDP